MIEHSSYYGSFLKLSLSWNGKFIEYNRLEWTMSYLNTKDGVEIDLVISRPNASPILVEIKSTKVVTDEHLKALYYLGEI